jgi:hypothetical protein
VETSGTARRFAAARLKLLARSPEVRTIAAELEEALANDETAVVCRQRDFGAAVAQRKARLDG